MSTTAMEARIQEIARLCHPVAAADPRVLGLYLFGSEAERTAGEHSNIDLAVLFPYKADVPVMEGDVHLRNLGACEPFLALARISHQLRRERSKMPVAVRRKASRPRRRSFTTSRTPTGLQRSRRRHIRPRSRRLVRNPG